MSKYVIVILLLIWAYPIKFGYSTFGSIMPVTSNKSNHKVLFVGDSFTSNYAWGWQEILSKKMGYISTNKSQPSKQTKWMAQQLEENLSEEYKYCFIYGGINDIFSGIPVDVVVDNVTTMVNKCIYHNVIPVIILGYDPKMCIRKVRINDHRVKQYVQFQEKLTNKFLKEYLIIKFELIPTYDCFDWVCHMTKSGHQKMAEQAETQMKNFFIKK